LIWCGHMCCLMITLVLTLDVMSKHTCGWQLLIELVNVVLLIQILGETSSECVCIGVCILWRKGHEGSGRDQRLCEGRGWRDPVGVEDGEIIFMCIIDVCAHVHCVHTMYVSGVLLVCYMVDILCIVWWISVIYIALWHYK